MNLEGLRNLWRGGRDRASFAGENIFRNRTAAKKSLLRQDVFPYLNTYTSFRTAKRPRVYNPYFARALRTVIQSDLIFMDRPVNMVPQNDGFRYILIVQDVFSRKIWTKALKRKSAADVRVALDPILNAQFIIDRGTEYLNQNVRTLLQSHGLTITHPSDGHASHVERANLSLQRLLMKPCLSIDMQL